jgi:hypothetical protein
VHGSSETEASWPPDAICEISRSEDALSTEPSTPTSFRGRKLWSKFFSGRPKDALNTLTLSSAATLRSKGMLSHSLRFGEGLYGDSGRVVGAVNDWVGEIFEFESGYVWDLITSKIDLGTDADAVLSSLEWILEVMNGVDDGLRLESAIALDGDAELLAVMF